MLAGIGGVTLKIQLFDRNLSRGRIATPNFARKPSNQHDPEIILQSSVDRRTVGFCIEVFPTVYPTMTSLRFTTAWHNSW